MFHVDGGINPLPTGGYVAQLALTNHTTVCAHFDEDGRRYLEDASRKYAEWNAQQDSLEQQLQVQIQPGTIMLSGGKGGTRVLGGGGGLAYTMGSSQRQLPRLRHQFPLLCGSRGTHGLVFEGQWKRPGKRGVSSSIRGRDDSGGATRVGKIVTRTEIAIVHRVGEWLLDKDSGVGQYWGDDGDWFDEVNPG